MTTLPTAHRIIISQKPHSYFAVLFIPDNSNHTLAVNPSFLRSTKLKINFNASQHVDLFPSGHLEHRNNILMDL